MHRAKITTTSVRIVASGACLRAIIHFDLCPFIGAQGTGILVAVLRWYPSKKKSVTFRRQNMPGDDRGKNILIKFTDFGPAEAFLPAFMKAALTPRIPHTPRKKNT